MRNIFGLGSTRTAKAAMTHNLRDFAPRGGKPLLQGIPFEDARRIDRLSPGSG